ncbi:MAG TPA: NrdJb, partial [Gammaproteobacteria bacterium]|nr:NrdJb [Gammaproteobacteria bacterium]
IGDAIDSHMRMIGMIRDEGLDEHQQKLIDQKRREFEDHSQSATATPDAGDSGEDAPAFPPEARLCLKCQTKAVVMLDGCMTCLNCGDSKCG